MLCKCSWLRNCQNRSQTRVEGGTELSCAFLLPDAPSLGKILGPGAPLKWAQLRQNGVEVSVSPLLCHVGMQGVATPNKAPSPLSPRDS